MCKIYAHPADSRGMKMRPPSQTEEQAEGILSHSAPHGGGFLWTVVESNLLRFAEQRFEDGR